MNKQQLAAKIWEAANQMRSKIEANEYKDYILGFIFYKFLSDKELKFLKDNDFSDEDISNLSENDTEMVGYIQDNLGYFISYDNLFSTWINKGKDFDISNVRDGLSAFNRFIKPTKNKVFDKIFDTLQAGLSKLGDTAQSQTKAVSDLLYLINVIPMDGKQDYDVLGFIYEYLISMFAANAGKKAGEFYTPHEVSVLMSEIIAHHLKDRKEIHIYDSCSGSGSLLINIGKSAARYLDDENKIKYYAQELKSNTYNLTRMNLVMRGINPDNIVTRNADTLENDWPYFEDNDPAKSYYRLRADACVSNPPYSQKWDSDNKENDPRYARFGLAPKGKADFAFLLHDLYHIKPDGIMTIVLPHGVLFRGGEEGVIRKNLIENNNIDTIIGLPANIFFGTGIPTIIIVLKQERDNTDVLIIDASKGFTKEGKNNKLRQCDIKRIVDTVIERKSTDKYSRVVTREEIRNNDYNLNIPRYVDSSEKVESYDIYSTMFGGIPDKEINELNEYWEAFPSLKKSLFKSVSGEYSKLNVDDIKSAVMLNKDVADYNENYSEKFSSFKDFLNQELIERMSDINIQSAEEIISTEIKSRLSEMKLVDYYSAYQAFSDIWSEIAVDLEMIQTEGFDAIKKVDPNMVVKKKNGKDVEVQEGWLGHILPFGLVQDVLLSADKNELDKAQTELADIESQYSDLLESFTDEEKESEAFTDEKDDFVAKTVSAEIKQIKADIKKGVKYDEDSYEIKLLKYEGISTREKDLKSLIKKQELKLENMTIQAIENMDEDEAIELLKHKWMVPITDAIDAIPENIINELIAKINALSTKYDNTMSSIEEDIKETEKSLAEMMKSLTGNEYDKNGLNEFMSLLGGI